MFHFFKTPIQLFAAFPTDQHATCYFTTSCWANEKLCLLS